MATSLTLNYAFSIMKREQLKIKEEFGLTIEFLVSECFNAVRCDHRKIPHSKSQRWLFAKTKSSKKDAACCLNCPLCISSISCQAGVHLWRQVLTVRIL